MRVLVVDDEPLARRRLSRMLAELPDLEVAAEASTGLEALQAVRDAGPFDGMLLDIRMPDLDGMAVARTQISLPPIVFVTAYDEFAVRAFELNAVDYLLKPVRAERLAVAIARLRARTSLGAAGQANAAVLDAVAGRGLDLQHSARVVSLRGSVVRLFDARDIVRFHAEDKYTVFRADGEEHLIQESLDALQERFAPLGFERIHRAELVQLRQIVALETSGRVADVRLTDGQRARVSRRVLAGLKAKLGVCGRERTDSDGIEARFKGR